MINSVSHLLLYCSWTATYLLSKNVSNILTYLGLQLVLTFLQFRDASSAVSQHGLLLLQRQLQLQVLLVGALTDLSGTAELLLQGGRLKDKGADEREYGTVPTTTNEGRWLARSFVRYNTLPFHSSSAACSQSSSSVPPFVAGIH